MGIMWGTLHIVDKKKRTCESDKLGRNKHVCCASHFENAKFLCRLDARFNVHIEHP